MEVVQGYADEPQLVSMSDDILALFRDIFPHTNAIAYQQICCDGNTDMSKIYTIVVTWYNRPMAMAFLRWDDQRSCWYLFNFGVRKSRRREGYGRYLLSIVRDFTKGKNLGCYVHNDNIGARYFYLKNGAEFTDQYDDTNHFWVVL